MFRLGGSIKNLGGGLPLVTVDCSEACSRAKLPPSMEFYRCVAME